MNALAKSAVRLAMSTLAGPLVLAALPTTAGAQVLAARVDPADISKVLVVREETSAPMLLKTFDGRVVDAAPSPTGDLVAAIVAHEPPRRGAQRVFRLHLLDDRGQTFRTLDHVQKFVFSPDERFIAVIRGGGYEGGPGFYPQATEILGLVGPDLGPIEGLENATDIAWAGFPVDGMVLLARVFEGQSTIVKYVISTRTVVPTHYYGLNFSPDGLFYYLTPAEAIRAEVCEPGLAHDSCVRVFAREAVRSLRLPLDPQLRRPLGWADASHILLANERSHACEAVDVVEGQTDRTFPAVDWRWNARPGFVVQRKSPNPNYREVGALNVTPTLVPPR